MARRDDAPNEPQKVIVRRLATYPIRFQNRTVHVTVPVDWPESIHHDSRTDEDERIQFLKRHGLTIPQIAGRLATDQ